MNVKNKIGLKKPTQTFKDKKFLIITILDVELGIWSNIKKKKPQLLRMYIRIILEN